MSAFDEVQALLSEVRSFETQSEEELEQFRRKFLGSKNIIKPLFSEIKNIPPEERREFGMLLNTLKKEAEQKYNTLRAALASQQQKRRVHLDWSLPPLPMGGGSMHPITIVMQEVIDIFKSIGFEVAEDREIEDDWHNFTAMNTPEDHPARDMQDTFYTVHNPHWLLRTHTSSVQARVMERQKPPIRIIAPGRVYRNETISARSHCQFHQVEGLYIAENVSMADLKQTLWYFARRMYGPDVQIRFRPSYFPFTEPSAEMDVYWGLETEADHRITKGTGWLEILGCGMVDPAVLDNCGIDPDKYTGFAFGMGIERQAMLKYKIDDIRLFFENDLRFLRQFSPVIH